MRRVLLFSLLIVTLPAFGATVTLLHFSDYHSHALPSFSEDRADQGGIARAIGYLHRQKRGGALVFNGGDMMNRGAPAWSDKYECVEWDWLNGIVDAMAFGNHDADYGADAFARCRNSIEYPILSANTDGFRPYVVRESRGLRIGAFAVAASGFPMLVKVPGMKFGDPVEAARRTVRQLRDVERVNAVVLIGHQHEDADFALARAVPGIDVIFGTHSHIKRDLMKIPETATWYISPFQYLTYVSRVELSFAAGKLENVTGGLVPMDKSIRPDRKTESRVAKLQNALERDPAYRDLFEPFATLERPMPVAQFSVEAMRAAARADVALSTVSSFRQSLPPGPLDAETLRAALPYDNELLVAELPASAYRRLLELAEGRRGTDSELVIAGAAPDSAEVVTVATTDYLARAAAGYRDVFASVPVRNTGLRVRQLVRERIVSGARAP